MKAGGDLGAAALVHPVVDYVVIRTIPYRPTTR
jgi:hypothetical protein